MIDAARTVADQPTEILFTDGPNIDHGRHNAAKEKRAMATTKPLTHAQERVMTLMSRRWPAEQSGSMAVHINGKRVCNIDTMNVLERLGLVFKDTRWTWKATETGLQWPVPQ